MLIIAIGYGSNTDPYSCSCDAIRTEVNPHDMDSVLKCMMTKQSLLKQWIDELLVVENDMVIASYNFEDGLGPTIDLEDEDEDEDIPPTLREEEPKTIPFKVEYDLKYHGGDYTKVGSFVIVNARSEEDIKQAFTGQTGFDSCHIIHYCALEED